MLTFILILAAFICFSLAAFNVVVPRINFIALGLALWVFTVLIGVWPDM